MQKLLGEQLVEKKLLTESVSSSKVAGSVTTW
jgi:hypothetical protein